MRARYRLHGPGMADKGDYECRALTDAYRLVVDYGPHDTTRSADPDIHWRLKVRDSDAVKILPEAPLWGVELELCRRDPRTYDYVRRPPATGAAASKRRKSARPSSADMGPARRSFADEGRGERRSSARVLQKKERVRSRSRPRSAEVLDERESVLRENMPHRREKDRAWWEGEDGGGRGVRNPRRSSMRV